MRTAKVPLKPEIRLVGPDAERGPGRVPRPEITQLELRQLALNLPVRFVGPGFDHAHQLFALTGEGRDVLDADRRPSVKDGRLHLHPTATEVAVGHWGIPRL